MTIEWPGDLEGWARLLTFAPILLSSVVGVALTLAKARQLRRALRSSRTLLPKVESLVRARDAARVREAVRGDASPAAALLEGAMAAVGRSRDAFADEIEQAGRYLARRLNRGLGAIALIAALGPLFGLLGTVVGIAIVFDRLAAAGGVVSPGQLAGGIGTALYTTIAGLVVGICALVSHRWLAGRADEVIAELEGLGRALVTLTHGDPE